MEAQTKDTVQTNKHKIEKQVRYEIDGKVFLVQPVFQERGTETLSSILFRMMEADFANVG